MKYIFGNWKMYLDAQESVDALQQLVAGLPPLGETVAVGVFPSSLVTREAVSLSGGSGIAVGAQNVAWVPKGAYTGAVSALLYKEVGCGYAIVGHSERRHIFHETDDAVRHKIESCLDVGLIPVVCVGETQEDLDNNKREYRVKKQLMKAFQGLANPQGSRILIAYEPVWAIGSGQPCDPVLAAEMHTLIRKEAQAYLPNTDISVLYGGSVDEVNVISYLQLPPIDGVLVGSASTHPDRFIRMIKQVQEVAFE